MTAGVAGLILAAMLGVGGEPPETVIDSGPHQNAHVANPSPEFTFSSPSPEADHFECRIDEGLFEPCASPHAPAPLADGAHRFEVRAVSLDGHADASPAARAFAVDTSPPGTQIRKAPHGVRHIVERRDGSVLHFGAVRGGVRFECRIDGPPWRRCPAKRRLSFGPGRHLVRVRAVDQARNVDPTPVTRIWRVRRWEPGVGAARRWASSRAGRISFSVDLGWRHAGLRESTTAYMASTIKVMLMVAYLRRSGVRDRALTTSERAMLGAMIRRSDNAAATRVRDIVGADAIRRLARNAGMGDFSYSSIWGLSRSSAADQAPFMRELESYVPARHWRFAREELAHIVDSQRWGIGAINIRGWDLHFKGGWGSGIGAVNHQIALLRRGSHRIGIAILTQSNPSHEYGSTSLREIAQRLLRGLPARPD